ncbi:MAG: 5'/3'-nucleotidase SurE [Chloroflexi bacterium]|nr:5'/3'-nucleotidase SurE [Chloroflexota bacterium]
MKILVTNDDGINAEGLWALVSELKEVGSVTVVAPDREQSGVGTSISFHHPIRLTRIHEKIHGIDTYTVEGTPGDSVIMAIKIVMKDGIDLVVSGINQGPNCGYDVFLSGTVGAALQGFFYSIPSIAVSMSAFVEPRFETGARVARELAGYVKSKGITGKMLLNVNVPNLPLEEIRGIDITRLGEKIYSAGVETGHDGRRDYFWILHRGTDVELGSGTDIWAIQHKRISITPLRFNRSEYSTEFVHEMATIIAGRLLPRKSSSKNKEG